MHTDLYRWFDENGELLYVGISICAFMRACAHRHSSFYPEACKMTVERLPSRRLALQAEGRAIRTENPLMNIQGRGLPKQDIFLYDEIDDDFDHSDTVKLITRGR